MMALKSSSVPFLSLSHLDKALGSGAVLVINDAFLLFFCQFFHRIV